MDDLVQGISLVFQRRLKPEYYEKMLGWLQANEKAMIDKDAPKDIAAIEQQVESGLTQGTKWFVFLDLKTREPKGAVWFDHMGDRVYNGHLVFDKDYQYKEQSARNACNIMFHENARKLQWMSFFDNVPFRRFLERRVGAQYEGCLRKLTLRNGEYVDTEILGTFPEDLNYGHDEAQVFAD